MAVALDDGYVRRRWDEYRRWFGTEATPRERLEAYCFMSGYEPLDIWIPWHLGEPDLEWDEKTESWYRPIVHKLALGGTGGGKSEASLHELAMNIIANPGCDHLMCAPVMAQIREVVVQRWKDLMSAMEARGFPLQHRWYGGVGGGVMMARLVGDGFLLFRSLVHYDNLRGPQYATVWQDEGDHVPRPAGAMEVLQGRIRHPLALRLEYICSTSPNGLDETVTGRFIEARKDPANRRLFIIQRGNYYDNPHLPKGYAKTRRAGMSKRRYRQEMLGEILVSDAVVYTEFVRHKHVIPYKYDPGRPYTLGYDGGDQFEHCTAYQQRADGTWIIFSEWISDETEPEAKREASFIRWLAGIGRWPSQCFADKMHKRSLKFLQRVLGANGCMVDVMRTDDEVSVVAGIELVRAGFDPAEGTPRLWVSEDIFAQPMHERGIGHALENYRFACFSDGRIDIHSPLQDNKTEHAADSSRYGWVGINRKPRGPVVESRASGAPRRNRR